MKNKLMTLIIIILIFFLLILLALFLLKKDNNSTKSFNTLSDREVVRVLIGDYKDNLSIEYVNSTESITQGLSDREEIGSDGMLFDLPTAVIANFWMKNMLIDLDFVWIKDNIIVDLETNVPKPEQDTILTDLETYSPDQIVDMVLELNSGDIEKYGFKIGDVILLIK